MSALAKYVGDLFGGVATSIPIARKSDPATSHRAAREITDSGVRANQSRQVLEAVRQWPDHTSRELAVFMHADRHTVARRLPELEAAGFVTKGPVKVCQFSRKQAVTWRLRP